MHYIAVLLQAGHLWSVLQQFSVLEIKNVSLDHFHFTFNFISVLFAADVKVTYDDYRSTMIATADSKTIVTVNPGLLCQLHV